MRAIHTKPGRLIEYGGELNFTPDIERDVEILQYVYSFTGKTLAVCRVGNSFETIPLSELKPSEPFGSLTTKTYQYKEDSNERMDRR